MIRFLGAETQRGTRRIGPIDLEVTAGEYHVLLGPNGAGKTTLLDMAAGVLGCRGGSVAVEGRVGYLLQDHAPFPHRTVLANAAYGPRAHRMADAEGRARAALASLGVAELGPRMPGSLSGGERRRVALAQVLAVEPSVLLLDEPTHHLDPPARRALLHDVQRLRRELGLTVLHVTHDVEEAFAQADRVTFLRDGALIQSGAAAEVFRAPRDESLARFVGVENILAGSTVLVDGATHFDTGRNRLRLAEEGTGTRLLLRAEDVLLARVRPETSARNVLPCRVAALEDRGATARVTLDANGDELKAVVTRSALDELGLRLGDDAWAAFKASALRLL